MSASGPIADVSVWLSVGRCCTYGNWFVVVNEESGPLFLRSWLGEASGRNPKLN